MRISTRFAVYALGALSSMAASAALAQTSPNDNPASSEERREKIVPQIEEVVVTAERRLTRLQDTPAAVTAITAAQIEQGRIVNLADAELSVPSLTYIQISHDEAYLSIRGTSVKQSAPGTDLGVSVFIDDVPTTGIGDDDPNLFDLQSIEVLRGPQGTLFGRNVTGGAVLIRTAPPSFTPELKAQATYGSWNLVEARALVTGPLIADELAGKLTFEVHRRDPNIWDQTLHRRIDDENWGSLRGQLLWTPSASVRVRFSGDFTRDTSQGRANSLLADFKPTLFPNIQFGPGATNDPFAPESRKTIAGLSARADWDSQAGELTSITGYRDVEESLHYNAVGDPAGEFSSIQDVRDRQFTEEVHLASPTQGRRFNWIVGAFYLHSDKSAPHHFDVNVTPGTVLSYVPPYNTLVFTADQNQAVTTQSEAIFGEANYAILKSLKLTLGGRYTHESRTGHSEVFDSSGQSPYIAAHYSHDWSAFTPKTTLAFEPTQRFLAYATVATGFQSGGYDISASTVAGLEKPFNPEKVVDYELGAKLTTLGGRAQTNIALFRADYTDLQRTRYDAKVLSQVTSNAGKARVQGVEFEGTVNPTIWLTLGGAYTFTDAKYTDYVDPNNGSPIIYTGNILPTVAKNQGHASLELHPNWLIEGGKLKLGGDVTYRSTMHIDDANDEPAYLLNRTAIKGLLNLHLEWRSEDGGLDLLLWGKNVANNRTLVDANSFTPFFATLPEFLKGGSIYHGFFTEGPTFGVTLTVRR